MTVTLPPFQTLLDEHGADLHRYLVASVGPHDGADCFQETVIAALRAYPGLAHDRNLRGWLFTIAHRKVIDHARGTGRRALPVGFVGAAEAKEALRASGLPAISNVGERGGSAVAAAALNVLWRLSREDG